MHWLKSSVIFQVIFGSLPILLGLWLITQGVRDRGLVMHAIIALYALLVLIYKRLGIRFIVFDSVTADKAAVSDTNAINSETDVQTVKRNYTPVMVSFIIFGVGLLFGFGIGPQILANGFTPALQMAWSDGTILFLSIFGCLFIGVPLFLMRYVQDPE